MQQTASFETTWDQLQPVLVRILCGDKEGIDNNRWMGSYTFVSTQHIRSNSNSNDTMESNKTTGLYTTL